jgi:hypothetical protein
MDIQELHFIQAHPHRSTRDKQLHISEARSHTARVCHDRKRLIKLSLRSHQRTYPLFGYGESGPSQISTKSVFAVSLQNDSRGARNNNAGQRAKEGYPSPSRIQKHDPNIAGVSFSGTGEQAARFKKILPAVKEVRQRSSSDEGTKSGCPHPMSLVQRGNTDPFSALPMKITSWNHSLIEIWKTTFTQSMVPSALQTSSTSLEVWSNEGKEMTQCLDGLSLILAWTSMLRSFAMPKSPLKDRIQVDALAYKAVGLAMLRKGLSPMSKFAAIRAMFHAQGAEWYSGDIPAAMTHFNAIIKTTRSVGGPNNLPWDVRLMVIISDISMFAGGGIKALALDVVSPHHTRVVPLSSLTERMGSRACVFHLVEIGSASSY